jgi:hypothetical protein
MLVLDLPVGVLVTPGAAILRHALRSQLKMILLCARSKQRQTPVRTPPARGPKRVGPHPPRRLRTRCPSAVGADAIIRMRQSASGVRRVGSLP